MLSRKNKPKTLADHAAVVEDFLRNVGINPVGSRIKDSGKNRFGWIVVRGSATVYITIDDSEGKGLFRIFSPILKLPQDKLLPFYRRLLEMNFAMIGCAFAVKDDSVVVVSERYLEGLDPIEIEIGLDQLSYVADGVDDQLAKEFGAQMISNE
jgi:hypothetical protein